MTEYDDQDEVLIHLDEGLAGPYVNLGINVARISRDYLKDAVAVPVAYIHAPYLKNADADPLDVEFLWDEEGFGEIAAINLKQEYVTHLMHDPEQCRPLMPKVIESLRNLADELESLYQNTPS